MSTLRVDRIEPYLSSSIDIVGFTAAAGGATTGSNDFIGNQTVTGSIDITGQFLVNGSPITGSGGGSVDTASLATTGSNVFQGNQFINGILAVTASGGSELKVNDNGTVDVTSTAGFNIVGGVGIIDGGLNAAGALTASALQTNLIAAQSSIFTLSAAQGAIIAMGGNKLEVSGSIETGNIIGNNINGNTISGQAVSASNGFSGNGSGVTNVNAATFGGFGTARFASTGSNTFTGAQTISSASFNSSISSISINSVDASGGMGQSKVLGLSANPRNIGGPYATWSPQPTIFGQGPTGPYQIAEFQSQGNFTDGTVSFQRPLVVTGSIIATGDITAPNLTGSGGGTIDTGSFATTGSNEFVGKQGVTGSFEVSGSIILTGSLLMTGSATFINNGPSTFNGDTVISTIDNLPSGTPGQIAFQGGKMHVYIGGQWNEVQFVSSPPPPSSFEYSLGYNDTDSASACNASPSNFYSDVDTLGIGEFLWTGPGLATKVDNGYYAGGGTWYEVTGGDGEITDSGACAPSFYEFDLAFSGVDSGTACSNYPSSTGTFYSSNDSLGIGSTIYLDSALSSVASNDTWYSDGTLWYYQEDDAISDSNNCA